MKTKKIALSILLCLALIVWGVTVAYASMTVTLNFGGTTYVTASSWNIGFSNLAQTDLFNATENQSPTITGNVASITGFNITYNGLNATVEYEFDVVNNGTFNAEIDIVQLLTPTCTGTGTDADKTADENLVCSNFVQQLSYTDGSTVQIGDSLSSGETRRMRLRYTYTTDSKPNETVNITGLGLNIIYIQN